MRKTQCYMRLDWLNIFTEPIKFRITSIDLSEASNEEAVKVWSIIRDLKSADVL